ncbi:ATP-dependent helicase HrpB [Tumebacillus algifaecis]|uniref:ATP-dependent helicase HrpB n=1 Tax=Tumebacillus algifaecis TaxID=1214604 RepID=A0A223CWT1_9BACL|nr:ATP-dependent helicase HrpB [Tumebacillus algifaecis]ASS73721.1 ATP-dependent helicase HrpB [Tumebacillus algifaecis]
MATLPIEAVLPALKETLGTTENAVLVAAPGAGKTTRVPLALFEEPWLCGKKIVMLEPRRLAARAAAAFMARQLGESVGETVGYRVRMDTRVGPKTRIEVITEGVLTRMLQNDPALEEVGLVIFDEFHERNLHGDLGLALCLQSQALLREELRILVMSATLEAETVAELLGDAPVLSSAGRAFPVQTRFLESRAEGRIEPIVVQTIKQALAEESGDLLVFLPGTREIRRVESQLQAQGVGGQVKIVPLHGALSREAQDAAIAPSTPEVRKVVLATSIAETSLTVEGVRVVIDSGLMRVPRFSPRTGMSRLETVTVSRPSAEQRRGRAGRVAPGVCYRLWTEHEDKRLPMRSTPEILEADLAPLALELAVWGVHDPTELAWLDAPPAAAFAQARELLCQLGALTEDGTLTAHGKRMAEFGLHPRLAHLVLQAVPLQLGSLACELAAVLNERDFLPGQDADLRLRVEALRAGQADRGMIAEANRWKRALGVEAEEKGDLDYCGLLLAFAHPDRIAQRRGNGRFLLRNGRGAMFLDAQPLSFVPYLVAAELDDQGTESRIFLAAHVEESQLREHFQGQIETERIIEWDGGAKAVRARRRERLGSLLLKETTLQDPDADEVLGALLRGIAVEGLDLLPWTKAAKQLQERLTFMHQHDLSWPDVTRTALTDTLAEWLAPHLYGLKNREDLQRLQLVGILESMLSYAQRRELDECAPTHLTVPSGSRIPIDYSDLDAPVLAVRLQEMFGLQETPRIAHGRVPLTLHLLSPAQRPVQVTRDLASFWQNAYFEVKKDLKGRYPKHHWPDDPNLATPTHRAKPRGS